MTADELAAELYRRQGYLVVQSTSPDLKPGEILRSGIEDWRIQGKSRTPLRIIGRATLEQAKTQTILTREIVGGVWPEAHNGRPLYLVEAAD